jgi:LacI family repressor for deo operon, udp, cdd, tsx, nupC, and nupG
LAVTIYDIAKEAQVSPATVSRALSGSTLVSERTRERVIDVAKELGYIGGSAQSGALAKGQTIAVFISNVLNPALALMVKGVQNVLKNEGYSMILYDSDGKASDEYLFLQEVKEHGVTGLIMSSPHFSSEYIMTLREIELPFVLAFSYSTEPNIPCVYVNNIEASFKAVQKLFELGHRRIGFISGPVGDLTISRDRLQGCRLAYLGEDVEFPRENVVEGDYSVESGYAAASIMLTQWRQPPTAIFAFNDMMAIGALNALREKGVTVPEDISLMGFDGIEFASLVHPSLSTVVQPSFGVGQEAAQILLRLVDEEAARSIKKELPYELVMRDSTAPVRE